MPRAPLRRLAHTENPYSITINLLDGPLEKVIVASVETEGNIRYNSK